MNDLARQITELPPGKLDFLVRMISKKNYCPANTRISSQRRMGQPFPLSFAQQRLWFLDQLNSGSNLYNEFTAIRLSGHLSHAALISSVNEVIRRHEILRTTFSMGEDEPQQIIKPVLRIAIPLIDLRLVEADEQRKKVREIIREESARGFDLSLGPLLRVTLLRTNVEDYLMLLTMHHIVSDAWSIRILIRELTALYKAFSACQPSPLPRMPIQYADFAYWQRKLLSAEVLEDQLAYWKKALAGAPKLLNLQTDRPREAGYRTRGAVKSFVAPAELATALKTLASQERVTQFIILLSAFLCLLHRYTTSDDIVVGADIANRHHGETEGLIGFFVNMLALRFDLSNDPTFLDLLGRVRKVAFEAYANQDLPFERLVEELCPVRDPSYTSLFQVVFNYYPLDVEPEAPGLEISAAEIENQNVRFDLSLFMVETRAALKGSWRYSTDLFDKSRIDQFHEHYEALLNAAVAQPELRLSELILFADPERNKQMERNQKLRMSNFKRFIDTMPRPVKSTQEQLVNKANLSQEGNPALLLTPAIGDLDLTQWARSNREYIRGLLLRHGALLFRNFNVSSPSEFRQIALAISGRLLNYNEPSSPRTEIDERIYTSTDYPADQWIQLHNEMSYTMNWPTKVFFYCLKPAERGGETPLAYSRKVFESLNAKIKETFIKKKVMYVRNFDNALGLSWQRVFQSKDQSAVESYCQSVGIEFQWKEGGGLHTRQVCPAVTAHPGANDIVWFNQAHAFHKATLDPVTRQLLLEEFSEDSLPRNAYYGDGSRIDDSIIEEIREVYRRNSFSFTWQAGDLLILDNIAVAHGRAPFLGPRKVLVALAELDTFRNA
jgi:alpha-ketoglutarate-dependent taurine dioxygenase